MKKQEEKQYVSPLVEIISIEAQGVLCSSAMNGNNTESFQKGNFNIP